MDDEQLTTMTQRAPYPEALAYLISCLSYREREGWEVSLSTNSRGAGCEGLTLIVRRHGPNTYHPEISEKDFHHYFEVPAMAWGTESWMLWLFDRLGDVDTHERMENFLLRDSPGREHITRPFDPGHGHEHNPYAVRLANHGR